MAHEDYYHRQRTGADECSAIQIARKLHEGFGDGAPGRARGSFLSAVAGGNIARADLYHAVCVLLAREARRVAASARAEARA